MVGGAVHGRRVNELETDFILLFEGNPLALGTNEGGCLRVPTYAAWQEGVLAHLRGDGPPVGAYPMFEYDGGWFVGWGCIDIDFEDVQLAWNLHAVLAALDITAWVERSRSKGYHVWVFVADEGGVPARTMQHALRAACQIADYEPKEVNPKQLELLPSQLGNYVRLPYPHGANERQVMIDPDGKWFDLTRFVERAVAHRTRTEALDRAAALYIPPPPPKPAQWDATPFQGDATAQLSGLAYTIYKNGPLPGSDRSTTLFRLAAKALECGLSAVDVLTIMLDADNRWGKFAGRSDQEAQLIKIIERAS